MHYLCFYSLQIPELPPGLPDDLFLLLIQSEEQAEAYRAHAGKILCVDSTHKTNQYRFKLVSAVVSDENGEGGSFNVCSFLNY